MRGNTDRPVESLGKDEFQIEPYVTGLAEFIEECDTPMTIAIQGDWGCGKTSMMNMTRDYLKQKKDIVDVWFNTWQFSQFNMDEQLVITFLHHLIGELSKGIADVNVKKKVVDKFAPIIKDITVGMTKQFIGSDIGDVVDNVLTKSKLDIVDEISELKSNFQELVLKATAGEKRVVVFIDDLDRLQPVRAVELLEILKLFVDCDNCVFVMAIDTSVVFQGIREKYGNDMSDEKAQSFFDKMIQMPFKMPIAYYRLGGMLERLLDFLQEETLSVKEKTEYITLFKKVTNGNPRSLKRLANSVLLTEKVAEKKNIYADEPEDRKLAIRRILVTLSCIQMKYESTYNFLVNDMTYKRLETVQSLKLSGVDDGRRGEVLIDQLAEIGLPRFEIEDKLVFYDVLALYIKALNSYDSCSNKYGISHTEAVKQMMRIVTLNNVAEEIDRIRPKTSERLIEKVEYQENPLKWIYSGMCVNGQYKEAYALLTQRGMYLPLSWIGKVGEGHDAIKEMKKDLQFLENCVLYNKLDEILYQYDNERKVNKREYDTEITYKKAFQMATLTINLRFDPAERCLYLNGKVTDKYIRPMEETSVFLDKLLEIHRNTQEMYSAKMIANIDRNITVEKNQEGGIQKLEFYAFPIINEDMANAIIEYATFVFKNMESYYQEPEKGYVSGGEGGGLSALLRAAECKTKQE